MMMVEQMSNHVIMQVLLLVSCVCDCTCTTVCVSLQQGIDDIKLMIKLKRLTEINQHFSISLFHVYWQGKYT